MVHNFGHTLREGIRSVALGTSVTEKVASRMKNGSLSKKFVDLKLRKPINSKGINDQRIRSWRRTRSAWTFRSSATSQQALLMDVGACSPFNPFLIVLFLYSLTLQNMWRNPKLDRLAASIYCCQAITGPCSGTVFALFFPSYANNGHCWNNVHLPLGQR